MKNHLIVFIMLLSMAGVAGAEDFPYPAPEGKIRIVCWNIERLGIRVPLRTAEQISDLADRILTFDAAVFALQEIYTPSVLEEIRSQLGSSWQTYHAGGDTEHAFLYDANKVEMVSAEIMSSLSNPPYTSYPGIWSSRPISGVFRAVGETELFRIIGIHCHWNNSTTRSLEGAWLRSRIIELLEDPEEPRKIFLVGDYNDSPGGPPHTELQAGDELLLMPKENGDVTHVAGVAVDWFYVTPALLYNLPKFSTYVIRPSDYNETDIEFDATYSDHLPVFADMSIVGNICDLNLSGTVDLVDFGLFSLDWQRDGWYEPNEVAWWPIDEGEGSTVYDSVANNDGYFVDSPVWTTGHDGSGSAISFDGVDDYIEVSGYEGVTGTQSRTFSAWIRTNVSSVSIITYGDYSDDGTKWKFYLNPAYGTSGAIQVSVTGGYIAGSTNVADGNWHHIAAVLEDDGTPDVSEIKLYVDGLEESYIAVLSQPINTSAGSNLLIGALDSLSSGIIHFFDGQLDDIRIFDYPLTGQMIQDLYNGLDPVDITCIQPLSADFNDDCVADIYDLSIFAQNWLTSP